jgi:hypothetical protein
MRTTPDPGALARITFEAVLHAPQERGYGTRPIVVMPESVSKALPSRGMVMVEGSVNGVAFRAAVEPDGKETHWFQLDDITLEGTQARAGDRVTVAFSPTKEWHEPRVPADLQQVLESDAAALAIWNDITTMARWDWIRWIGATKQAETRKKRVESIPSRMAAGKRRPCCFDRSQCTLTEA